MQNKKLLSALLAFVLVCTCAVGMLIFDASAERQAVTYTVGTAGDYASVEDALAAAAAADWSAQQYLKIVVTGDHTATVDAKGILFGQKTIFDENGDRLPITITGTSADSLSLGTNFGTVPTFDYKYYSNSSSASGYVYDPDAADFVSVSSGATHKATSKTTAETKFVACANSYTFENLDFCLADAAEVFYFYAGSGEVVFKNVKLTENTGANVFFAADSPTADVWAGWTAPAQGEKVKTSLTLDETDYANGSTYIFAVGASAGYNGAVIKPEDVEVELNIKNSTVDKVWGRCDASLSPVSKVVMNLENSTVGTLYGLGTLEKNMSSYGAFDFECYLDGTTISGSYIFEYGAAYVGDFKLDIQDSAFTTTSTRYLAKIDSTVGHYGDTEVTIGGDTVFNGTVRFPNTANGTGFQNRTTVTGATFKKNVEGTALYNNVPSVITMQPGQGETITIEGSYLGSYETTTGSGTYQKLTTNLNGVTIKGNYYGSGGSSSTNPADYKTTDIENVLTDCVIEGNYYGCGVNATTDNVTSTLTGTEVKGDYYGCLNKNVKMTAAEIDKIVNNLNVGTIIRGMFYGVGVRRITTTETYVNGAEFFGETFYGTSYYNSSYTNYLSSAKLEFNSGVVHGDTACVPSRLTNYTQSIEENGVHCDILVKINGGEFKGTFDGMSNGTTQYGSAYIIVKGGEFCTSEKSEDASDAFYGARPLSVKDVRVDICGGTFYKTFYGFYNYSVTDSLEINIYGGDFGTWNGKTNFVDENGDPTTLTAKTYSFNGVYMNSDKDREMNPVVTLNDGADSTQKIKFVTSSVRLAYINDKVDSSTAADVNVTNNLIDVDMTVEKLYCAQHDDAKTVTNNFYPGFKSSGKTYASFRENTKPNVQKVTNNFYGGTFDTFYAGVVKNGTEGVIINNAVGTASNPIKINCKNFYGGGYKETKGTVTNNFTYAQLGDPSNPCSYFGGSVKIKNGTGDITNNFTNSILYGSYCGGSEDGAVGSTTADGAIVNNWNNSQQIQTGDVGDWHGAQAKATSVTSTIEGDKTLIAGNIYASFENESQNTLTVEGGTFLGEVLGAKNASYSNPRIIITGDIKIGSNTQILAADIQKNDFKVTQTQDWLNNHDYVTIQLSIKDTFTWSNETATVNGGAYLFENGDGTLTLKGFAVDRGTVLASLELQERIVVKLWFPKTAVDNFINVLNRPFEYQAKLDGNDWVQGTIASIRPADITYNMNGTDCDYYLVTFSGLGADKFVKQIDFSGDGFSFSNSIQNLTKLGISTYAGTSYENVFKSLYDYGAAAAGMLTKYDHLPISLDVPAPEVSVQTNSVASFTKYDTLMADAIGVRLIATRGANYSADAMTVKLDGVALTRDVNYRVVESGENVYVDVYFKAQAMSKDFVLTVEAGGVTAITFASSVERTVAQQYRLAPTNLTAGALLSYVQQVKNFKL